MEKKLNIFIIIESDCYAGGGFNQALNAILQTSKLGSGRFEVSIVSNLRSNLPYVEKLGFSAVFYRYSLFDRAFATLRKSTLGALFLKKIRLISSFERFLIRRGADLVYFVNPSGTPFMLQKLNYVFTLWDLCHRDFCEFPEVRASFTFDEREVIYRNLLVSSSLVVVESDAGKERASRRYGVDIERLVSMPLSVGPFLENDESISTEKVLSIHKLERGFFFYPAQFWAHKNHFRILQALKMLQEDGFFLNVVFSGADVGNADYLKSVVVNYNISKQVRFLDFVPNQHLKGLYEAASAVVMPTYFGPTNIPPLEAWTIGVPLIYSQHLEEQAGNAALLIDPDDVNSLAAAMKKVLQPKVSQFLVENGKQRLIALNEQRKSAELEFEKKLRVFAERRKCWE